MVEDTVSRNTDLRRLGTQDLEPLSVYGSTSVVDWPPGKVALARAERDQYRHDSVPSTICALIDAVADAVEPS